MRKDTLQFMNTSQSHQYTLPLVKALRKKTFSSIPDLATPAEDMSPAPDQLNDSGYETQDAAPADVTADQDSFQDKDRQKTLAQALEDDLSKAPWQKESAKGPLEDLEKIAKVVKPIYEGFWHVKGTRT